MRIIKLNFYGDHNIGLFAKASEKFCILGRFVSENNAKSIKNALGVRIIKSTIANTDLVGLLLCMNSHGIVLPAIINEDEIENLKQLGLNTLKLKSKFTAVGNLILCNDKGAVIGKPLEKYKEKIERCLAVDAISTTVASMDTVGSCGIATNTGCLLHRDAKEKEMQAIEKALDVVVGVGTANFGSPFIGSCAIANSSAIAVGESTTGIEMNRFIEVLHH